MRGEIDGFRPSVKNGQHGPANPTLFNLVVDNPVSADMFNRMVELQALEMDTVFHALGDATRRRMLNDLTRGSRTVGQLAEPFDMSLAAASKHIKALENARLIRREVQGRTHVCHLEPAPLERAHGWLGFYRQFWTDRLDALGEVLADPAVRAELEAEVSKK